MNTIKTGVVVFATADTKEGRAAARAWLKEKGFTPTRARLYAEGGMVLVETLAPWSA